MLKSNSLLSREIILQNPFSENLEEIRSENRLILKENREILDLQLAIQKYLSSYSDELLKFQEDRILNNRTVAEWFELTVNGIINLDENHPLIRNREFLNDLLLHYQRGEHYEKCQQIVELINRTQFA